MRVVDVRERLSEIVLSVADPEQAHSMEDDLWRDVLIAIVSGCRDPRGLAEMALRSRQIDFPRWYS